MMMVLALALLASIGVNVLQALELRGLDARLRDLERQLVEIDEELKQHHV